MRSGRAPAGLRLDLGWTKDHVIAAEAVKSPLIREMRGYWMGLAACGRIPRLADLDAGIIAPALPFITLSRIISPDGTVGYIRGAPACEALDGAFTGKHIDETNWQPVDKEIIRRQYRDVLATRLPVFGEDYFEHDHPGRTVFEWSIFPMRDEAGGLNDCLIIRDYSHRRPVVATDDAAVSLETNQINGIDPYAWIDDLTLNLFLIDGEQHILWHSRQANGLIDAGDITDPSGRLLAPADPRARVLLRHACQGWDGSSPLPLVPIERRSGDARVYALLRPAGEGCRQAARRFLVIVIDPKREVAFPVSAQRAFGLTKSEGRLAGNLANGVTLQDYATLRGITVNTARTILKSVFAKVGVERQADLIRIVLSFSGIDPDRFA